MQKVTLNLFEISDLLSESELTNLLRNADNDIELIIPCPSIGSANSHLIIAVDLLDALFVGESIADLCEYIFGEIICDDSPRYYKSVHIRFSSRYPEQIAERLYNFSTELNEDTDRSEDYSLALQQFQLDLLNERIRPHLWEVANDYMANWVGGLRDEFEVDDFYRSVYAQPLMNYAFWMAITVCLRDEHLEEIKNAFSTHPEWAYGFWKVITPKDNPIEYYSSYFDIWIVPHENLENRPSENIPIQKILDISNESSNEYMGRLLTGFYNNSDLEAFDRVKRKPVEIRELLKSDVNTDIKIPKFCQATYLASKELRMVYNKNTIAECPSDGSIFLAQMCAVFAISNSELYRWPVDIIDIQSITDYYLSEDGEFLVLSDNLAQYVFFNVYKIPLEKAERILNSIGKSAELFGMGELSCPWDQLDDEKFEELCYDIISQSGRYNSKTIRKMGKSRSRDGGRDIVVESKYSPYSRPDNYIVQCKLIRGGRSLAGSKINVSDTVAQYGANGFCVMTNGVIDATLYDKLDGIRTNNKIKIDHWSKFEIERFLARRPDIRKRYFGS